MTINQAYEAINNRFDQRSARLQKAGWMYTQCAVVFPDGRKLRNQAMFVKDFPMNSIISTFVLFSDDQVFESECQRNNIA